MKNKLKAGDIASGTKVFSEKDVSSFAALVEDFNPVHFDAEFAKKQFGFQDRIIHGMLAASLFSGLLAEKMPGPGTVYLGQTLNFRRPIFLGQEIKTSVEVKSIRKDKPIVTLSTICTDSKGETLIEGEAVVKVPADLV